MNRVKLRVSYDGTGYAGWQVQGANEKLPTIQGTLEKALEKIFKQPVRVHGSGRTDAGAHAVGQICHFDAPRDIGTYNFRKALGRWTPDSISIVDAWVAPREFHSLFSAKQKTYKYIIFNHPTPSALRARYAWWVERPLDLDQLNEFARPLIGEHDFKSFQTTGTDLKTTTVRTLFKAEWRKLRPHLLEFTVSGSGFLKQMVRNIVGTQVELLLRDEKPERMTEILNHRDRRQAGFTAPAHGLYLYRVDYPLALDNKCRKL